VNRLYGHSAPVAAVKPGIFSDIKALSIEHSHGQASTTRPDVVGGAQALLSLKSAPHASSSVSSEASPEEKSEK
jgi:hypothetical protein